MTLLEEVKKIKFSSDSIKAYFQLESSIDVPSPVVPVYHTASIDDSKLLS